MAQLEERINFIILGDRPCFQEVDDMRTCHDWMLETLNLEEDDYVQLTRGYIRSGRIQFLTGGSRCKVSDRVTDTVLRNVATGYKVHGYHLTSCTMVGNGCIPGEVGELWKPTTILTKDGWQIYDEKKEYPGTPIWLIH